MVYHSLSTRAQLEPSHGPSARPIIPFEKGFATVSQTHMGCSTARNKGTCDNRRTIKREALEELVLCGLEHQLRDPVLCTVFAEEFARHLNRLVGDLAIMIATAEAPKKIKGRISLQKRPIR